MEYQGPISVELDTDRRTLSKRLSGLRPDDERTEGGKQIKRWRLSRVLAHLRGNGQGEASHHREALNRDEELVCRYLYPAVLSSRYFRGLTINYLRKELGGPNGRRVTRISSGLPGPVLRTR